MLISKAKKKQKGRPPYGERKSERVSNLKKKKVATVYVQCTKNNTILTLVNKQGETKGWISAGCLGFKNSRKSTAYAAEAATAKLAKKTLLLGYKKIKIKMRGLGYSKRKVVKWFSESALRIVEIEDKTPLPYNGCRPPRKRRV